MARCRWCKASAVVTSAARSTPSVPEADRAAVAMADSARAAGPLTGPNAAGMAPASRMWRVSRRVSMPASPGSRCSPRKSPRLALRPPAARPGGQLADDEAPAEGPPAFIVGGRDPVVADVRIGETDDLAGVGRVGQHLLVAGEGGVEDHLADRRCRPLGVPPSRRLTFEGGAVGEHQQRLRRPVLAHRCAPAQWSAPLIAAPLVGWSAPLIAAPLRTWSAPLIAGPVVGWSAPLIAAPLRTWSAPLIAAPAARWSAPLIAAPLRLVGSAHRCAPAHWSAPLIAAPRRR